MADYQNALDGAIPSIINAGFAAASSRKEREFAREMYERQLKDQIMLMERGQAYNTDEREAAQAFEETMWNKTNQYNSPSAQLARMMQAGINPNSAVGGVSNFAAAGLSSSGQSSPGASVPGLTGHQVFNPQFSELGLIASQIGLNEANTEGQRIENEHKDEILDWTAESLRAGVRKAESDVSLNAALQGLNEEQANRIRRLLPLELATSDQELQNMQEALKQVQANTELMKAQVKSEGKKQSNIDADTNLKRSQKGLVDEQINSEIIQQDVLDSQVGVNEATADVKGEEYAGEVWRNQMRSCGVDPSSPMSTNAYNLIMIHSGDPRDKEKTIGALQQSMKAAQNVRSIRRSDARNRRFSRHRRNNSVNPR